MTFFLSATIAVVTDEITQRRQFSFKNPLLFIKFHFIVLLQNTEELECRFWAVFLYFFQYLEFWNCHLCFMSLKLVWLCSFYWFFFFFFFFSCLSLLPSFDKYSGLLSSIINFWESSPSPPVTAFDFLKPSGIRM